MIKIVDKDHDKVLPGEAIVVDIGEGKRGLLWCCPGCGKLVGTTRNQWYDEATQSIMMGSNHSSVVHNTDLGGCGFHKTLIKGEWGSVSV